MMEEKCDAYEVKGRNIKTHAAAAKDNKREEFKSGPRERKLY